jgi:hypothetical protein
LYINPCNHLTTRGTRSIALDLHSTYTTDQALCLALSLHREVRRTSIDCCVCLLTMEALVHARLMAQSRRCSVPKQGPSWLDSVCPWRPQAPHKTSRSDASSVAFVPNCISQHQSLRGRNGPLLVTDRRRSSTIIHLSACLILPNTLLRLLQIIFLLLLFGFRRIPLLLLLYPHRLVVLPLLFCALRRPLPKSSSDQPCCC